MFFWGDANTQHCCIIEIAQAFHDVSQAHPGLHCEAQGNRVGYTIEQCSFEMTHQLWRMKHATHGCCHPMVHTTQQTLGGDGLYGGYASACVRLDARHGVRCGWTPALGELRWLTVSGGGAPQQRPLLLWSPAMAGVGLVARHGGRQVGCPPWRLSGESPAMACVFPVCITTLPSCTHYVTYTPPLSQESGAWAQDTKGKTVSLHRGCIGEENTGRG